MLLKMMAGLLLGLTTLAPALERRTVALPELYDRLSSASVEILKDKRHAGSGWIASPDGLVITAGHIFRPPSKDAEVLSPLFRRAPARVVAVDLAHDLALLQLDLPSTVAAALGPLPTLPTAPRDPHVGETIYLFGAPQFRHHVLLPGTLGKPSVDYEYMHHYVGVWYVSGPAPKGTSGGPWVNSRGEVVALQSGGMTAGQSPVGITFAAPRDAIALLLERRGVARSTTISAAIEELWEHDANFQRGYPEDVEGVVLRLIADGGAASAAGLREYDLVVAAGGRPVRFRADLMRMIRARKPGDSLPIQFYRNGESNRREATITLGHLEADWVKLIGGKDENEQ